MIFNFRLIKSDVKRIKERQNELLQNIGLEPQTWEKSIASRASIRKSNFGLGIEDLSRKSFSKKEFLKVWSD